MRLILLQNLGCFLALVIAASTTVRADESGAYYDWTITRLPERPYLHHYDQTLVYKISMAAKLPGDQTEVLLRCDQTLDVIRRVDRLTAGVPKIVYVVGWQYSGHDSKYPAWAEVNAGIKRPQDTNALDSLKWLMSESKKYHTTVSLHINMMDAYENSPLWNEYLTNSVIAKGTNGVAIKAARWPQKSTDDFTSQSYNISYAREWELGLAQRRIDGLLAMLPVQQAGTIHIDAFHTIPPTRRNSDTISPFLGYSLDQEAGAQRKIIRYFRDHGVDVTSEFSGRFRRDPFIGLQPMAYHFEPVGSNVPPSLDCGTAMESMQGMIRQNPETLPGLVPRFCTLFLPWYIAHVPVTLKGNQTMIGDPKTATIGGEEIVTGDDVCFPAPWRDHTLIAFSRQGYDAKSWELPPGWETVQKVRVTELTMETNDLPAPGEFTVTNHVITLSLKPMQGVLVTAESH